MFIQIIQGHITDSGELREAFENWRHDLAPGADGWLGTTAGITAEGELIAVVRFDSPEAAQRNSHRPEQHQWWTETAKLFSDDATFHESELVDTMLTGGSDDAGFVQVIQGRTDHTARLRETNQRSEQMLRSYRPDIIGGTVAWHDHGEDGAFTETVYFSSEPAAREGERKTPPPELAGLISEERELSGRPRFYDLPEPWFYSPRT